MSSDEFLPEWFRSRKGRQSPFGWMDRWFSDVDEMFANMFQDMLKGDAKGHDDRPESYLTVQP